MKLKQRVGALMGLLVVALSVSLLLNLATYGSHMHENRPGDVILNRELNSFDSEPSNGQYERSEGYAWKLVQALNDLKQSPDLLEKDSGRSPKASNISYHNLVRKLLQDKSFNTDTTINSFIALGKSLESFMNPVSQDDDPGDQSAADPDFFNSNNDLDKPNKPETKDASGSHPQFHLDPNIIQALNEHVQQNRHDHYKAQARVKKPVSFKIHKGSKLKSWQNWQNSIDQYNLYDDKDSMLPVMLKDLSNAKITGMSTMADYGTQIKVIFKLEDGSQALFKPMRIQRDQERNRNLYYFDDFERHHAEIAAFHLDRVMQFHRVPPNAGRVVNITSSIEHFASKSFKKTIYISPAENKCFYGKCDYYCDSGHSVCGTPGSEDVVEGSMAAWLPFGKGTTKKSWENPWRRSYSKFRKAEWETDNRYCDKVKKTPPMDSGRRLLDIMDITIFDYLAGNQDRHHFHTFKIFGNFTSPMLYDNGRGFGFIDYDDPSILVPLVQCCQIRYTTLRKLLLYETDDLKLSGRMRQALSGDPLSSWIHGPVLSDGHLKALDRRVSKILDAVWRCVSTYGIEDVVLDDGI